jgi:hypothetical protein
MLFSYKPPTLTKSSLNFSFKKKESESGFAFLVFQPIRKYYAEHLKRYKNAFQNNNIFMYKKLV